MKKAENIISSYGIEVKKYSTFNKLIRTTAWINRIINNLKSDIKKKGPLSNEETKKSKMPWINHIQKEYISVRPEIERSNKDTNKPNTKSDENGILRCYGRLTPATEDGKPLHKIDDQRSPLKIISHWGISYISIY